MIRLNCSKVTLAHLALKDIGEPPVDLAPSTLGNWHVHVAPFYGRTVYVFMNERTLPSFLIYEGQRLGPPGLLLVFEKGQDLVLQSIGVAAKKRRKLAVEAEEVVLSPITSPKARAQCNAIMEDYAQLVEAEGTNGTVSADQMVREVNSRPRKALGWSTSEEVTLELLNATAA
jgi:hypothetical protein